jgi:RNA polymerase sigma-70 factor, ECF subfamily
LQLQAFDASYLERLRSGDSEVEKHFTAYFGELLFIKLRSRLRSAHQIEDVRQETFLRVFRVLRSGTLREAERLGAFVNSVCNNVLLELYRSQGRHPQTAENAVQDLEAHLPGPEDELISRERQAHVRRVIDDLPPRDRGVLRAVFLEERDKDEIVAQFGVDRDYLRVLLHRAKMQFRARYEERTRIAVVKNDHRSSRTTGS